MGWGCSPPDGLLHQPLPRGVVPRVHLQVRLGLRLVSARGRCIRLGVPMRCLAGEGRHLLCEPRLPLRPPARVTRSARARMLAAVGRVGGLGRHCHAGQVYRLRVHAMVVRVRAGTCAEQVAPLCVCRRGTSAATYVVCSCRAARADASSAARSSSYACRMAASACPCACCASRRCWRNSSCSCRLAAAACTDSSRSLLESEQRRRVLLGCEQQRQRQRHRA